MSQVRPQGTVAPRLRRSRPSLTNHPSTTSPSITSSKGFTNRRYYAQSYCYQEVLPTELWRLILGRIPILDLFSMYNTSQYMRALAAPILVRVMATKSLRLCFYQEYVGRIWIKFEFDYFDLQRDLIVFRPQDRTNQQRLKCGRTLQSPQLEEIEMKNTTSASCMGNIQCSEDGRYFTIRRRGKVVRALTPVKTNLAITTTTTTATTSNSFITDGITESGTGTGTGTAIMTQLATPGTAMVHPRNVGVANTSQDDRPAPRKLSADEKGYLGNKNFLDRTCPVHVRKDGIHVVDGARYCFVQGYPWSLHYQVDFEPMGSVSTSTANISGTSNKTGSTFFVEPTQQQDPPLASGGSPSPGNSNPTNIISSLCPFPLVCSKSIEPSTASISNSGPRYFRVLRFECSMNFLDPKRATRNIIGRWVEGKVQHWKKILGVKKPQQQLQLQQQQQQQQAAAAILNGHHVGSANTTRRRSSGSILEVLDLHGHGASGSSSSNMVHSSERYQVPVKAF